MTRVAGVDGCRGGWAVATLDLGALAIEVHATIAPLLDEVRAGRVDAIAIDMPIGLPDDGRRACDTSARAQLGPRRSSLFPTPVRAVLGSIDHADACSRSEQMCGRRISVQAFNLVPRIAELDAAMSPDLQDRVVESHPELAFARLAGAPLTTVKRTGEGRAERRRLLRAAAGLALPDRPPRGSAADDVADAAVLALVALDVSKGSAVRIGDGTRDARGLRMEIVSLGGTGPSATGG